VDRETGLEKESKPKKLVESEYSDYTMWHTVPSFQPTLFRCNYLKIEVLIGSTERVIWYSEVILKLLEIRDECTDNT
jgi:hypothetical protein